MKTFFVALGLLIMPLVASAQSLEAVMGTFSSLINTAIPLVLALAVLYFFWGLAQFIFNQGSEDKKSEGRDIMIYGIIALFVMVSIWGLIRMLQSTFSVTDQTVIIPKEVKR